MTCRAYFIPVPLMGLTLRGFTPFRVPYALSNAASLSKLTAGPKTFGPSPGLGTPERSRPDPTVLPANPANTPLGLGPFEVYDPASQSPRVATVASVPLTLFRLGRETNTSASQGSLTRGTRPFSLEIDQPP
jgi:hypothetical protein